MQPEFNDLTNGADNVCKQASCRALGKTYHKPEVHEMGSLDVVQNGRYGDNYDYNPPWLYYQ